MKPSMCIRALWPNVCTGKWVSHIAASLCEEMAAHVPVRMHVRALAEGFTSPVAIPSVPAWATRAAYHLERHRPFLHQRAVAQYLRAVGPDDLCWLWPGDVVGAARALKRRGNRVVVEAINCHQRTAARILAEAHRRVDVKEADPITEESIAQEEELFELADMIFTPSPRVAESLLEHGVEERKIIRSSYGWSPARFDTAQQAGWRSGFNALFAGSVCVRKGAHLLAAAWRDAGVQGRLRFAGRVDYAFGGHENLLLAAPGIEVLGHRDDVPRLMATADVLAFPTLEEGSPLVVYEAAAMGMAIVTSPMGAGEIIRDGREGLVLDPYDHDGWVDALRLLARDSQLRTRLGNAARARARGFTWDKVAARRVDALSRVHAPERMAETVSV